MRFMRFGWQDAAGLRLAAAAVLVAIGLAVSAARAEEPKLSVMQSSTAVEIRLGERPLATYVLADKEIARPFYSHVHAPSGDLVTRPLPPKEGTDPIDHATMHPGLWLAFGD